MYKVHICLWKIKDKSYSYNDKREKARQSVRSKINNLRSAFRKELKNLRESKKQVALLQILCTRLIMIGILRIIVVYCRSSVTPGKEFDMLLV